MLTPATGALAGLDPARLFADIANVPALGLAVSGGADSLALMLLYARWAETGRAPRAIVYTVDHQLRAEAQAEAAFVIKHAIDIGLDARVLRWEGPKPTTGLQAAARKARYRLMGAAMAEDGATVLLTGHHMRDQAETIMMRMAHGSGISGLRGMQPHALVEGIRVFRPLLAVAPDALGSIARDAGLSAVMDPSNTDTDYERVRWRQILPQLGALGLTEGRLAAFGMRLARVNALADAASEAFFAQAVTLDGFGVFTVGMADLQAAPEEVGIRTLSRMIAMAGGGATPGLGQIEMLWQRLLSEKRDGGVTLSGAKIAYRGGMLTVYREGARIKTAPIALPEGTPVVWDGRFAITAMEPGISVCAASQVTRRNVSDWFDAPPTSPMPAVRAAPLIRDVDGRVLAIGTLVRGGSVLVRHVTLTSPA